MEALLEAAEKSPSKLNYRGKQEKQRGAIHLVEENSGWSHSWDCVGLNDNYLSSQKIKLETFFPESKEQTTKSRELSEANFSSFNLEKCINSCKTLNSQLFCCSGNSLPALLNGSLSSNDNWNNSKACFPGETQGNTNLELFYLTINSGGGVRFTPVPPEELKLNHCGNKFWSLEKHQNSMERKKWTLEFFLEREHIAPLLHSDAWRESPQPPWLLSLPHHCHCDFNPFAYFHRLQRSMAEGNGVSLNEGLKKELFWRATGKLHNPT